jgi:hypothetical protein
MAFFDRVKAIDFELAVANGQRLAGATMRSPPRKRNTTAKRSTANSLNQVIRYSSS